MSGQRGKRAFRGTRHGKFLRAMREKQMGKTADRTVRPAQCARPQPGSRQQPEQPRKNASDRQPGQLLRFIPSRLNLCHASPPCAYHLIAISEILPQSLQISWLMPPTACRLPAGAGKCFVIFSRRFADPAFLSSVFSEPHSGQGGHLFMAHSVSCMASLTDVNRHAKSEASPFSQPPMTNDFLQERQ